MSLPPKEPTSAALVTGTSSGLGMAIAEGLARRGHNVVLAARRLDRLEELAARLAAEYGVRAHPVRCDLGEEADRRALVDSVAELGLAVEILVNNAGFGDTGRFQDLDGARQQEITRVNVEAVVALCGHYVAPMCLRGRGAVLNVASTTAFQPLAGNTTYAATKAFVLSFTEALHGDLTGTGVTATALCPGPVKTELWEVAGASGFADLAPGFLWTSAEKAAEDGIRGLETGRRVVVPGTLNRLGALGGQHAPRSVLLRLSGLFGPR